MKNITCDNPKKRLHIKTGNSYKIQISSTKGIYKGLIGCDKNSAELMLNVLKEIFKDFPDVAELFKLDGLKINKISLDNLMKCLNTSYLLMEELGPLESPFSKLLSKKINSFEFDTELYPISFFPNIQIYEEKKLQELRLLTLRLLVAAFLKVINSDTSTVWVSIRNPDKKEGMFDATLLKVAIDELFFKNDPYLRDNKVEMPANKANTHPINETNTLISLANKFDKKLFYIKGDLLREPRILLNVKVRSTYEKCSNCNIWSEEIVSKSINCDSCKFNDIDKEYTDATMSQQKEMTTNLLDMFVHEVLGEALSAWQIKNDFGAKIYNAIPVQVENLNRLLRGETWFRTGEQHGGPYLSATLIPQYLIDVYNEFLNK